MKIIKKRLLTLLVLGFTLCIQAQKKDTITFTIEGMTCQSCANTAERVFKKIKGVKSAKVLFSTKTATIITNKRLEASDLEKVLERETNFEVILAGDSLTKPLTEDERQSLDIKTVKGLDIVLL